MAAKVFEGIWDVITTGVNAVTETIEWTAGWVLCAVAFVVQLVFLIPILGRLVNWVWNLAWMVVWFLAGSIDALIGLAGVRPEKKLRVSTIVLMKANGDMTAQDPATVAQLQLLIDVFFDEANVRVVRSAPFQYDSGFAGKETADADWLSKVSSPSHESILKVDGGTGSAGEDLGVPGSRFGWLMNTRGFYGNFRRLIGYGAPVTVFVVEDVDGVAGVSLGPLSNRVSTDHGAATNTAHEVGHACLLPHKNVADNLLHQHNPAGRKLTKGQAVLMRLSGHVTYF